MSGLLKWDMLKIDESTLQTIKNLETELKITVDRTRAKIIFDSWQQQNKKFF